MSVHTKNTKLLIIKTGTSTPALVARKGDFEDWILSGLPSPIQVHVSHTQSVLQLPENARVLASSVMEPHAAIAFAPQVWGVQFHPEFDADIVCTYIREFQHILKAEGQDPARRLTTCHDTPIGTAILRQFANGTRTTRPHPGRRDARIPTQGVS